MAVAKIAHPKHKGKFAIPHRDDSVLTKHQRLCPLLWLGHLDKHAANEEGIHDGTQDGLEEKEDDAFWTFVSDVAVAIANGGLSLYEEEEGRGEVVDIGHTGSVIFIMSFVQVAPHVGNDPPHGGHEEPGHSVCEDEDEEIPTPFEVHQGGEEVRQVAACLAAQVAMLHVAPTILVHKSLSLSLRGRSCRLLLVKA